MIAPERIWADPPSLFDGVDLWHEKQDGAELTAVEYIRKDASDAAISAARAEGVPSKEAIYALALRMWAVHPKDLDAAGYDHVSRGGKYENPRAAWYADQIEALCRAAAEAQP